MGVIDNRKVTPGITELSPARARIDLEACYFAVVSPYPGGAAKPFSLFFKKEKRNALGFKEKRNSGSGFCKLPRVGLFAH